MSGGSRTLLLLRGCGDQQFVPFRTATQTVAVTVCHKPVSATTLTPELDRFVRRVLALVESRPPLPAPTSAGATRMLIVCDTHADPVSLQASVWFNDVEAMLVVFLDEYQYGRAWDIVGATKREFSLVFLGPA